MKNQNFRKIIIINIIFLLFSLSCEKTEIKQPEEKILVRIDDQVTISLNEFIRRAEFTIRPPFCKHNNYIHKKIILNSLIAEKLLVLEAGEQNPLLSNEEFLAYLKGRREQVMRQWMHNQEATQKVKLDSSQIKQFYQFAGREYEIEYYSLNNASAVEGVTDNLVNESNYFETLFQDVYSDSLIPKRKVSWGRHEHGKITEVLFSKNYKKGQVLPPIKIGKNDFLIIKITGWSDTKMITQNQIQKRWNDVDEELTRIKSSAIWNKKLAEIMRGKTIDFADDTFWKLNKIFFEIYFTSDEERKESIKEEIWDIEKKEQNALDELVEKDILKQPFFTIDGRTWLVEDFRKELMSHPLVFRERKMDSNEFPVQFRLAVVDLIRDFFVTEEAYKKGYDKVDVVLRNENMWRDAFLAIYQKNLYLKSVGEKRSFAKDYMRIMGEHLNVYTDSLQQKYYKKVELDFEAFEDIALTSIDLLVKQQHQPYPFVVPMFPVITTDNRIEYIKKMGKH
ncbi:hypothetical protein H8E88_21315 [candidate division KSB1 bacterium]|nr:hypothetical protein [candidate division KSB1 bacterium]MBL7093760.1 hypothetical protein [candidate division KSB1 bacterium]